MSTRWEPWDPSNPPRLTGTDWLRALGELLVLIALVVGFTLFTLILGAPAS
jgi:hypothetical protein